MENSNRKLIGFKQLCAVAKEQFSVHSYSEWIENVKDRVAKMGYAYNSDEIEKAVKAVERSHRLQLEVVYPPKHKPQL